MKKILLIICLLIQNSSLFAFQTDTLSIHEDETKLLTNKYFLELEDPRATLTIKDVISSNGFHAVSSTLPSFKYSKSTTWLKFVLKNKTTRAFVPVTIGNNVIDSFDLYFVDHPGSSIIHLSSAVPYRDTKLIKQNNTFINAIIFPDSTRTIYLRITSGASGIIPVDINSANTFFKTADFENILVGGFIGITLVMALYNLVLFIILRDRSYLYYVSYIIFLGLSQVLQRGYGTNFFISEKGILNNYLIPIVRVAFGFSVLLFAAEFLQLKRILKSYIFWYYLLYMLYAVALVAVIAGKMTFAYDMISLTAGLMAISLLAIGSALYFKGFKPSKFFMYGWGLFLITM
ncbi:MAG: 7TMR-DISM family protein, partial [Mucilaginibacter sp.]